MILQCVPMEKSVEASEAQEMMVSVPGLSAGSVCHSQTMVPVCTPTGGAGCGFEVVLGQTANLPVPQNNENKPPNKEFSTGG